jgi:hypothetical protein
MPGPVGTACEGFARAYCGRFELCTPPVMHEAHGTLAQCTDAWTRWCTTAQSLAGSRWSDAQVEACGVALGKRRCGQWRALGDTPIAECHPTGLRGNGAGCLADAQCGSGFCEREFVPGKGCGRCLPRAKSHGTCWDMTAGLKPLAGCPIGERCSRGTCLGPFKDEGETCGLASAWALDCYGDSMLGPGPTLLECAGMTTSGTGFGVCRFIPRVDKCPDGIECGPYDWCDAGTCRARKFVAEGNGCDETRDACLGGRCSGGKCVSPPKEGGPCSDDDPCAFPDVCVGGRCARTDPGCG